MYKRSRVKRRFDQQRQSEYILCDALAKSPEKGRGSFKAALGARVELSELTA